jgi:hypothetical protein
LDNKCSSAWFFGVLPLEPSSDDSKQKNNREEVFKMSRTYKNLPVRVHGKKRKEVDARRLARVVIAMAQAEAEAEAAEAQNQEEQPPEAPPKEAA